MEKVKNLYAEARSLMIESEKLENEAEKHLEDGNEMQYSDAHDNALEKDAYARGIMYALERLGYAEKKTGVVVEIQLNRGWIYDEDGETIGEKNFVVSAKWLKNKYEALRKMFAVDGTTEDMSYEDWLKCYVPEEDGQLIYEAASMESQLLADLGKVYY